MTDATESTSLILRARSRPPQESWLRIASQLILILILVLPLCSLYRQSGTHMISRLNSSPTVLLAVGDWGRAGCAEQISVARALSREAETHNAIGVLSTGDNFYEGGVTSQHDPQFNESYAFVYNAHKALRHRPFWPVLGNHDHLGDIQAQLDYTSRSRTWHFPATYYARQVAPRLTVLMMDTTPFGSDHYATRARLRSPMSDPDAQTEWLAHELSKAARKRHAVLVIGHHTPFSGSTCGHRGAKELRKRIEPLLHKHRNRVLAYVSGHEHAMMHLRHGGVDHLVSGAGSKLDKVCRADGRHSHKWRQRHGILQGSQAPLVESVNGFFRLEFDARRHTFVMSAVDTSNHVMYRVKKHVRI